MFVQKSAKPYATFLEECAAYFIKQSGDSESVQACENYWLPYPVHCANLKGCMVWKFRRVQKGNIRTMHLPPGSTWLFSRVLWERGWELCDRSSNASSSDIDLVSLCFHLAFLLIQCLFPLNRRVYTQCCNLYKENVVRNLHPALECGIHTVDIKLVNNCLPYNGL